MKTEGALAMRFSGMGNLSVRCVVTSCKLGPGCRFPGRRQKLAAPCPRSRAPLVFATQPSGPSPSYRTRRKERALPIVHDEFRRLFLEGLLASIALLRFTGHDQHKPIAGSSGTIYHRTVSSVLTVCLTKRGNPTRSSTDRPPKTKRDIYLDKSIGFDYRRLDEQVRASIERRAPLAENVGHAERVSSAAVCCGQSFGPRKGWN